MAELIRFALVKDQWTPLLKGLKSNQIKRIMSDAGYKLALDLQGNLRTASTKWPSITKSIRAQRKGLRSTVSMAAKGIYLDSMKPHYVALKRGRNVTNWVRRKSPLIPKTRKSKVIRGPKGGVVGGALYVTPTPWISKPRAKTMRKVNSTVRKEIKNYLKSLK